MTPAEQAEYLARRARRSLARQAAVDAMTPEQRADHEAAEELKRSKRAAQSCKRTEAARAVLDAYVDAVRVPGDLSAPDREPAVPQTEATMRGILLADFPRPKGARALIFLREWRGELRLLFTVAYVEGGRAVRSRGWTLYLRDVTPDGEVVPSMSELRAVNEALSLLLARLDAGDRVLAAEIVRMQEARERWEREHAASSNGETAAVFR